MVAPRVGVWIEIRDMRLDYYEKNVAPRVGVWIEIGVPKTDIPDMPSLLA